MGKMIGELLEILLRLIGNAISHSGGWLSYLPTWAAILLVLAAFALGLFFMTRNRK